MLNTTYSYMAAKLHVTGDKICKKRAIVPSRKSLKVLVPCAFSSYYHGSR